MSQNTLRNIKLSIRLVLSIAGVILGIYLVIRVGIFLAPFVIGYLISLIANPLVHFLESRIRIKRGAGSAITTVTVLAAVVVILYLICSRLFLWGSHLVQNFPAEYEAFYEDLTATGGSGYEVFQKMPAGLQNLITQALDNMDQVVTGFTDVVSSSVIQQARDAASSLPAIFVSVVVSILAAYYFMVENNILRQKIREFIPGSVRSRVDYMGLQLKTAIGGYFKAQLAIMVVIFAVLFGAFMLMGVKYSALWAILIAFLDFLPFFGTGFALIPWAAYQIFAGQYRRALILVALYVICLVLHQVLQPRLIGDNVGLDPLLTLLFLYIGYRFGGFLGIIIAIPLGVLFVDLYKVGTFDSFLSDLKELLAGIREFLKVDRGTDATIDSNAANASNAVNDSSAANSSNAANDGNAANDSRQH